MHINVVTDDDVGTDLTIVGTSANVTTDESFSAVQVNSVPRKTVEIQTELEPTVDSIKQKQDIILVFAMVDKLIEIINKEIKVVSK